MRSLYFTAPLLTFSVDMFGNEQPTCIAEEWDYDTDYHNGQGLGRVNATDEGDCCLKCSQTEKCRYFTFAGGKDCWMKTNNGGKRSYPGAISGGVLPTTTTTTTTTTTQVPPPVTKPVQVFILMGQSNMVGMGRVYGMKDGSLEYATKSKGLYPYMLDESGSWSVRDDVRYVDIMGSGDASWENSHLRDDHWLTVGKDTLGPEFGIGWALGNYSDSPVMILKSCIGGRSIGWDLLPPGSEQWEYTDSSNTTWVHAGYHDSPLKWEKNTTPKPINWKAGIQYDGDVARAKEVLANLSTFYPGGATSYEVAGFLWWQGSKDSHDELADRYEFNLVNFIKSVRSDFDAPNAKFVTATLGQSVIGDTNGASKILDAMFAVDGKSGKYPEFAGNVAAVYTHPLSKGGVSDSHYGGNAETYMNVGEGMGQAMVELLKGDEAFVRVI